MQTQSNVNKKSIYKDGIKKISSIGAGQKLKEDSFFRLWIVWKNPIDERKTAVWFPRPYNNSHSKIPNYQICVKNLKKIINKFHYNIQYFRIYDNKVDSNFILAEWSIGETLPTILI